MLPMASGYAARRKQIFVSPARVHVQPQNTMSAKKKGETVFGRQSDAMCRQNDHTQEKARTRHRNKHFCLGIVSMPRSLPAWPHVRGLLCREKLRNQCVEFLNAHAPPCAGWNRTMGAPARRQSSAPTPYPRVWASTIELGR